MRQQQIVIAKIILKTIAVTGIVVSVVAFPGLSILLKYLPDPAKRKNKSVIYPRAQSPGHKVRAYARPGARQSRAVFNPYISSSARK